LFGKALTSAGEIATARWKRDAAVFNDTRIIAKVVDWRDERRETPPAADNGVTVLHASLQYGVQRGDLKSNVAEKIGKTDVNGQRAEIVWTKDDLAALEKAAGEKDRVVFRGRFVLFGNRVAA